MKRRKLTQADQEAADWLVRLNARDASAEDFAQHDAWLKAKPENEYAYRIQQQLWDELPAVGARDDYEDLVQAPFLERWMFKLGLAGDAVGEAVRRPQVLGGFAALALVVTVSTSVFFAQDNAADPSSFVAQAPVEHATQVAEVREHRLPDGSVVTLGAASRISIDFSDEERRVTLLAGEAFFDVETDPTRPFFVEARDSVTRVVGTKFDVRLRSDTVSVSVAEGQVDVARLVRRGAAEIDTIVEPAASLVAGQAITLPAVDVQVADNTAEAAPEPIQAATVVTEIDTDDVAVWRMGRVTYVEARLADVVADLNRYYDGEIILGDDEVGNIGFTATPNINIADDAERLLVFIDNQLPVEMVRRPNGRVVLTKDD